MDITEEYKQRLSIPVTEQNWYMVKIDDINDGDIDVRDLFNVTIEGMKSVTDFKNKNIFHQSFITGAFFAFLDFIDHDSSTINSPVILFFITKKKNIIKTGFTKSLKYEQFDGILKNREISMKPIIPDNQTIYYEFKMAVQDEINRNKSSSLFDIRYQQLGNLSGKRKITVE